jgi:hypothetical protein
VRDEGEGEEGRGRERRGRREGEEWTEEERGRGEGCIYHISNIKYRYIAVIDSQLMSS